MTTTTMMMMMRKKQLGSVVVFVSVRKMHDVPYVGTYECTIPLYATQIALLCQPTERERERTRLRNKESFSFPLSAAKKNEERREMFSLDRREIVIACVINKANCSFGSFGFFNTRETTIAFPPKSLASEKSALLHSSLREMNDEAGKSATLSSNFYSCQLLLRLERRNVVS